MWLKWATSPIARVYQRVGDAQYAVSHPQLPPRTARQSSESDSNMNTSAGRIAVLVSYSGDGGVERMVNQLIEGMLQAGYAVDVLALRMQGGHFGALPTDANVVPLGTAHTELCVPALTRYLRRTRPAALLAAKDRAGRVALRARKRAGVATRIVIRLGNTLSQVLARRSELRRRIRYWPIRRWYPHADAIVAVSQGVAADVLAISGVRRDLVHVVPNPVVTPALYERAREEVGHPWLAGGGPPTILAVGRLALQKDYPTLLRAFARLRRDRDCRLLILGEGEKRSALTRLARELGISSDIDMPGFAENPYAYMARADLFVISSAWEGSPNSLTEALALGVPAVATDCPSGPREVLAGGRYGPLVPVGDVEGLAEAIDRTLMDPLPPDGLREAVGGYTRAASTAAYLRLLDPTVAEDNAEA